MNLTTNDLLIVIGEQTLTIKAQGMQIDAMAKRLKELEPPAAQQRIIGAELKAVGEQNGTG